MNEVRNLIKTEVGQILHSIANSSEDTITKVITFDRVDTFFNKVALIIAKKEYSECKVDVSEYCDWSRYSTEMMDKVKSCENNSPMSIGRGDIVSGCTKVILDFINYVKQSIEKHKEDEARKKKIESEMSEFINMLDSLLFE